MRERINQPPNKRCGCENDNNNQDGVRPASITVVLLADGNAVGTATLNASNNWGAS